MVWRSWGTAWEVETVEGCGICIRVGLVLGLKLAKNPENLAREGEGEAAATGGAHADAIAA